MMNLSVTDLLPSSLWTCDLDAVPLARTLLRAARDADNRRAVAPALTFDDADYLVDALLYVARYAGALVDDVWSQATPDGLVVVAVQLD